MSSPVLEREGTTTSEEHYHIFHANAHALSGHLRRPIEQKIEEQIPVGLKDRRGGHLTRVSEDFSVEGFVSYRRGITRVSGSRSSKALLGQKELGWTTLSTSILEDLNVFEVITAERVVSQVSTDHAYENGHVPFVTFLGTQFHNFRVSGFTATPIVDLGMVSAPAAKETLPDILNQGFLERVQKQNQIVADKSGLPEEVRKRYADSLKDVDELLGLTEGRRKEREAKIVFSLVQEIKIADVPGVADPVPGLDISGNVLLIPEFGAVALGEVELTIAESGELEPYERRLQGSAAGKVSLSYSFELTMFRMNLGCIGQGTIHAGSSKSNGNTKP